MTSIDDDDPIELDPEIINWTTRIVLRRPVRHQIRTLAHQNMRSTASMLGVLLTEAVTARSSA